MHNINSPPLKIIYHPAKAKGLAYWRCMWPAYQMGMRGGVAYSFINNFLNDALTYTTADVVVLQRSVGNNSLEYVKILSKLSMISKFKLIYDIDDVLFLDDIPKFHYGRLEGKQDAKDSIMEIMYLCNEITVSTQYLKEYYQKATGIDEITVLPNRIPFFWAGQFYSLERLKNNYRMHKNKPRIAYAGSSSHFDCKMINSQRDDFYEVIKIIEATRKEFTWVFIGNYPRLLSKYVESCEIEYYNWVPIGLLPRLIHSLNLNMMIAPLADNPYNHGKSNIKFLESAAQGLPIACQDITPYKETPLRFRTGEEMIEKIRLTMKDEESYLEESRKVREIVNQQWLEINGNISQFIKVYSS